MPVKTTVCVLLKAPVAGEVKTRLSRTLGAVNARQAYIRLAEHQLRQIPDRWRIEVHFSPADAGDALVAWLSHVGAFSYVPQCEGNLGERLAQAQATAFARGADRVVLIGGDCPELTEARLEKAVSRLGDADVVIVPAVDGGYALLASTKPTPELFTGIPWSTAAVLQATMARAEAAQRRVALESPVFDVDEAEDWARARAILEREP